MQISPQILEWLQVMLKHRFGVDIRLLQTSPKQLSLLIDGEDGGIEFDRINASFYAPGHEIGFGYWNANRDGWQAAISTDLPMPGGKCCDKPLIEQHSGRYKIHYDIPGLAYWMMTRVEELNATELDPHQRFAASSSHAGRNGYLERPVVDEWLHILGQVIQRQWPDLDLVAHEFRTVPSHDVDLPSAYAFKDWQTISRYMAGHVFKRQDMAAAVKTLRVALGSKQHLHIDDPANTFNWIMDLSERYGLRSAFFFICGRTNQGFDADYELEHPAIRALLKQIASRSHEIGLHPSYEAFNSMHVIADEASRLKRVCVEEAIEQTEWGGRMHYLRYSHPVTAQAWSAASLDYDSTMGYADRAGFRCGTCFDFPAFDPSTHEFLGFTVRPLIVMEGSVIDPAYMGLGLGEQAFEKMYALKTACRAVQGNFTLLWHNSELYDVERRGLYEAILAA